ncbi:MAG: hypothetical protein WAO76_14220 [Georgfuchsia sp.]
MGRAFLNGWMSLPTCGDVYLEHGLPRRVWVTDSANVNVERLMNEVADLTGLLVILGAWEPGENEEGMEAELKVNPADIDLILQQLAGLAAETFADRYQKAIDSEDVDYDEESFAESMQTALNLCGLHWDQVNEGALRQEFCLALHQASQEIAARYEH